ncbi:glycosyl hydrolase family 61-domain-containing protein [Phyllosticta citribraziliensis]|uniref:AA9 family lytic polysaccharide monooxygenase n=1 Tax=Phyllosticta citribraziliensis TaxID=989973 RepID=A0ABR1LTD3_9PEZI
MKLSIALTAVAAIAVDAHTVMTTLWVDGTSAGDGVGIRMRKDPATASFPISIGDDALACGYNGESGNSRVVPVHNAAVLSFEWRSVPNDAAKGAIDPGHQGPCAVYLKKVDSAVNSSAVGDGWFKIWDEGYDEEAGKWCNQKLGGNGVSGVYGGKLSVNLPDGLEGGYYLARPEILALHAAPQDPQFYTGCAQIFLNSDGNKKPDSTVSIPGYVNWGDSSVTFDVYSSPLALPYDTPGPPVAKLVSNANAAVSKNTLTQTEGEVPAGCILEMAGFCAYEVAAYDNMTACYAAAKDCWAQQGDCWNYAESLPTSGSPWCDLLTDKCRGIDNACDAGKYYGPPDSGKDLTPSASTTSVVMAAATSNYQVASSSSVVSAAEKIEVSHTTLQTVASSPSSSSSSSSVEQQTSAAPAVETHIHTVFHTQVHTVYATAGAKFRRHAAEHGVKLS